jgi:hypothetical protein
VGGPFLRRYQSRFARKKPHIPAKKISNAVPKVTTAIAATLPNDPEDFISPESAHRHAKAAKAIKIDEGNFPVRFDLKNLAVPKEMV